MLLSRSALASDLVLLLLLLFQTGQETGLAMGAEGNAPSLDATRLNYGDLLRSGSSSPQDGYRSFRELRALVQMWRSLPYSVLMNQRVQPRARRTLELSIGYGRFVQLESAPFAPGGSGQASVIEARGSNIDLFGSASLDLFRAEPFSIALESNPALRLTPTLEGMMTDLRLPLSLPIRMDFRLPWIVSPELELNQSGLAEESVRGLRVGLSTGLFRKQRLGLLGTRLQLRRTSYSGEVMGASEMGLETLEAVAWTEELASLDAVWLLPLPDRRDNLRFRLGGGALTDDRARYDASGSQTAEGWTTLHSEARVGGQAALRSSLQLGLDGYFALGLGGPREELSEWQLAFGLLPYLRAIAADRYEVAASVDVHYGKSTSLSTKVGVYEFSARWDLLVGLRF